MSLKRYVLTMLAVSALTVPFAPGISQAAAADGSAQAVPAAAAVAKTAVQEASAAAATTKTAAAAKQKTYSLKFDKNAYT